MKTITLFLLAAFLVGCATQRVRKYVDDDGEEVTETTTTGFDGAEAATILNEGIKTGAGMYQYYHPRIQPQFRGLDAYGRPIYY